MQSWQSSSKQQTRRGARSGAASPLADKCLQVVDYGLLAIVFVAPLFLGGRDMFGRLVFIALACITGVAWFVHQALLDKPSRWTRSWAYVLAGASVALLALQLVPLSWNLLQSWSPRNTSLLALWQGDGGSPAQLGVWNTLSLAPGATRLALATLIAYLLLFVAAVGRLQTVDDIRWLFRHLAIAAVAMAAFGLLQYFTSNGRFFWFYVYPHTDTLTRVKGSFSCSNHFVHYLVLCLGPLLAWLVLCMQPTRTKPKRPSATSQLPWKTQLLALCVGLVVVVFAIILAKSRGGALAFASTTLVAFAIFYLRGLITSGQVAGVAAVALAVVGLLSVYGYDEVTGRFDDFTQGSLDELDRDGGRRRIWSANLAAIEEGGLFGAGAGSHRQIYPAYLDQSVEVDYTHAENGYLQVATETGWLGVGLLACGIVLAGCWCWRANVSSPSTEQSVLAAAVAASLAASVVHSLVDFVWYLPACMSLTAMLLACALRLAKLTSAEASSANVTSVNARPAWIAAAAAASLAAVWAVANAVGPGTAATHWNQFQLASAINRAESAKQLAEDQQDDDQLSTAAAATEVMIFHLRNALARDPSSAETHAELASKYLKLFELRKFDSDNVMSVAEIRSSAIASQFASAAELRDWLTLAFGENSQLLYRSHYHARRALQLCPLQGECYLHLSNLSFLQGQSYQAIQAYIDQGLELRPHDFSVIFAVGEQLSSLGRDNEAIDHWAGIFRDPGRHQLRIIQLLSNVMPAAHFIEYFQPDWTTLHFVWKRYQHTGGPHDWQTIAKYATQVALRDCPQQEPKQAATTWRTLAGIYKQLEAFDGVLYCYQQAAQVAPTHYSIRRELGRTHLRLNQFDQAEPHLRWCLSRRPQDAALQAELLHAANSRVANRDSPTNQRTLK